MTTWILNNWTLLWFLGITPAAYANWVLIYRDAWPVLTEHSKETFCWLPFFWPATLPMAVAIRLCSGKKAGR